MPRKNKRTGAAPKKKSAAGRALNQKGTRFHPYKEWFYQVRMMEQLKQVGWKVYCTSEARARTTMDAGVPDIIAFNPLTGVLLFVECKRPTAMGPNKEEIWSKEPAEYMSQEQLEFRDHVAVVKRVDFVTGAMDALMAYLGGTDEGEL